jgi:hypothetical protein
VGTFSDNMPAREAVAVDGFRVMSGDFHVHAFVGDGGIAPWMMQRQAERAGLDVIAITNHHQTLAGRLGRWAAARANGPLVLVGQEITGRDYHLIGVGIERPVGWDQPARGAIADVHAQGGVAIAAHPMRGFAEGYDETALARLDGVEAVHRDSILASIGPQFEAFYHRTSARNPDVAAIGSSDFHTSGPIGLCRTYLLVREHSEAGVLDAIRDGRTVGRCESSRMRGRPELVRLLEPFQDALAPPEETVAQHLAMVTVWLSLIVLALVGPRS